MSERQRAEFLAEARIAVLAVGRSPAPPLAVPVWYAYEPGGDVEVQTRNGALKDRLVTDAGSFTIVVQDERPPYRYVSVGGPLVERRERLSAGEVEAMARRYFDGDRLAEYLAGVDPAAYVALRMRPERWSAADEGA